MGAAAGGEAAAPVEEKTEFDIVLESFAADKKIAVLKVVRGITGLGLKEAKELVEAAPKVLKEAAGKEEAEDAKKQIEEAGGVVASSRLAAEDSRVRAAICTPAAMREPSCTRRWRRVDDRAPSVQLGFGYVSFGLSLGLVCV